MTKRSGFTLIELLVVVAIIGLLVGITMPSLAAARRVSKTTKCKHNLHQIGLAMKAYLTTHRDTFPIAARLPARLQDLGPGKPPTTELPSLPVALKNEVRGYSELFECPQDRGATEGAEASDKYFRIYATSYEWQQPLSGKKINHRTVTLTFDQLKPPVIQTLPLKDVQMVYDFEPWHKDNPDKKGSYNILYADLRVDESP